MTQPSLIELVAGVLQVAPDQLSAASGPKTVAKWDSLAHVTIAAAAEQTYGVELTMPEILSIRTIADLRDAIQRHGAAISLSDNGN